MKNKYPQFQCIKCRKVVEKEVPAACPKCNERETFRQVWEVFAKSGDGIGAVLAANQNEAIIAARMNPSLKRLVYGVREWLV